MSWNGTVRCGHCFQKEHNRATCPQLLKQMTARREENPEDFYVKHYFDKKGKGRTTTCGWCEHSGHTRRTCKELINAKKVAILKCAEWRQKFVAKMKKTGLGIGALVRIDYNGPFLGILTAINWQNLDHRIACTRNIHNGNRALVIHTVEDVLTAGHQRMSSIPDFEGLVSEQQINYGYGTRPTSIIGPISQSDIEKQIPSDFLDGTDCIETIFQENVKSQDRPDCWQVQEWCELVGFYDN